MSGPQNGEVPAVQSSQLRFIEALNNRQNRSVYKPHVGVGIPVAQLPHPQVIVGEQVFNAVGAAANVFQERHQDARMQANMNPVVHLHQYGRWNHQGVVSFFNQVAASGVFSIAPAKSSVQGAGIQH